MFAPPNLIVLRSTVQLLVSDNNLKGIPMHELALTSVLSICKLFFGNTL